ncbi:hypothetical protein [Planctomycetes bacterium Poly30]|uniref:hypothetical protein n=1 Tax=Saltatorellus ferox TaxID=2528018 RepID=UPI0011A758BE
MKVLLLNGFDRCGSSLIGGLLARHPDAAYFFQPFNRTEVHASQHEVWPPEEAHPATERFLSEFLAGRVDRDFLGADLFERHSTAAAPRLDGLNVIKETKVHFKSTWIQRRFPSIALRGIWRNPRGILCSLLRNGFASSWYGKPAFEAISATVRRTPELAAYLPLLEESLEPYEEVALVIAARTHLFGATIPPEHWISYEELLLDCDRVLNELIEPFGLAPFHFEPHLHRDHNVSGSPSQGADLWRTFFSDRQLERLEDLFAPLEVAMRCRNDAAAVTAGAPTSGGFFE